MKMYDGVEVHSPRILNLSTRWRWVLTLESRQHYPWGYSPRDASYGKRPGPQSQPWLCGEEKHTFPCRESIPGCSMVWSLYRLSDAVPVLSNLLAVLTVRTCKQACLVHLLPCGAYSLVLGLSWLAAVPASRSHTAALRDRLEVASNFSSSTTASRSLKCSPRTVACVTQGSFKLSKFLP
jgi:hypothetical protein